MRNSRMSDVASTTYMESVKVIPFSGIKEDYLHWSFKVEAFADERLFWDALDIVREMPDKDTTDAGEKKILAQNKKAWHFLILSCTGTALTCVMLVKKSKNANKAWRNLHDKFMSSKTEDLISMTKEWTELLPKYTSKGLMLDPDNWFLSVEQLVSRFEEVGSKEEHKKSDDEIKAHMIAHLPKGFSEVVTKLDGVLEKTSVEKVQEEIARFWKRTDGKVTATISAEQEMTLTVTDGNKSITGKCHHCGKVGHKKEDCFKLKREQGGGGKTSATGKFTGPETRTCYRCKQKGHLKPDCPQKPKEPGASFFVGMVTDHDSSDDFMDYADAREACLAMIVQEQRQMWLVDSGSTVHVTNVEGMVPNFLQHGNSVTVGNTEQVKSVGSGKVSLTQKDSGVQLELDSVESIPGFVTNIISVGKLTKEGSGNKFIQHGDKAWLENSKGDKMVFTKHPTKQLFFFITTGLGKGTEVSAVTEATVDEATSDDSDMPPLTWTCNDAHERLGHVGESILRATCKEKGIKLTGSLDTCDGCSRAKARAKNLNKTTNIKATKPGERLFLDTSGPYPVSTGGNRYWIKIVDDFSRKSMSVFVSNKNQLTSKIGAKIDTIRKFYIFVSIMRANTKK